MTSNASSPLDEHYVYLYRDIKGRALYVGYGRKSSRATSHQTSSHNSELEDFLKNNQYSLEIAGPFESDSIGKIVETALISSLAPEFNRAPGAKEYRFRPLGVPLSFADRSQETALSRTDILNKCDSVLFVRVNSENFDDGRVGYDLVAPPTNQQILDRIDRWWQLGPHAKKWCLIPETSPKTLVGVTGRPGQQIVIGAVHIDPAGWGQVSPQPGNLYWVPTLGPEDLDAFNWRGRRLSIDAGLSFNSFRHSQFKIWQSSVE